MFKAMRKTLVSNKGSALFIVLVLVVGMAVILAALTMSNVTRSDVAERSNTELERLYAAQAGLERLRMVIMLDPANAPAKLQNFITAEGAEPMVPIHTIKMGYATVYTFIDDLGTDANPVLTWYLLRARAVDDNNRVTELGLACRLCDTFGKYALFSDTNLNIGQFARYLGNVHANGKTGTGDIVYQDHVTFEQDVTAKGRILPENKNAQLTVTFAKRAISGAPQKPRPTAADIAAIANNPPPGTVIYDWTKPAFQNEFKAATGSLPNNTLKTDIKFNVTNMTVVNTCGTKVMTKTVPIPNDNFIYCAGSVSTQGHISRRTSILTPGTITVTGPVRYMDDNNLPQYILYQKQGGEANFSTKDDMWAPVTNWKGNNMEYRQADDWASREPVVNGELQNPSLGLVAGGNLYIDNANKFYQKNVEIHAAMYSSDGVEEPTKTSDPNGHNLMLFGTRVQYSSSPNSDAWQFRHYTYDENLWVNPPPGFPTCIDPSFSNWHIVQSGDIVQ
jgi:hypothetical protein